VGVWSEEVELTLERGASGAKFKDGTGNRMIIGYYEDRFHKALLEV
jgi:hypothetical protein